MIDSKRSSRRRILVSADEFGISPRANRNTLYLISLGKINRVGVLANGDISSKEASELIKSGVKIDIHLSITTPDSFLQQKTGSNKALYTINLFKNILFGKLSAKKVSLQWENQIVKFRELFGKNPDGISSHCHLHFFPPFFKVTMELQNKFKIPFIRFGDTATLHHNKLISYILHYLRKINMKTCLENGCVSSGSFVSITWIKNFENFLDNLPEGTIEVSCHPEIAEDFVNIKKYF